MFDHIKIYKNVPCSCTLRCLSARHVRPPVPTCTTKTDKNRQKDVRPERLASTMYPTTERRPPVVYRRSLYQKCTPTKRTVHCRHHGAPGARAARVRARSKRCTARHTAWRRCTDHCTTPLRHYHRPEAPVHSTEAHNNSNSRYHTNVRCCCRHGLAHMQDAQPRHASPPTTPARVARAQGSTSTEDMYQKIRRRQKDARCT